MSRTRNILTAAAAVLLGLTVAAPAPAQEMSDQGPRVITSDGTVAPIDAVDPSTRTAGLLALYTPAFGQSTGTNEFGAEAVLQKTDEVGVYRVTDVCTVWGYFAGACTNPGDNPIPDDGAVLSAAPGGDPDVRLLIRDHVAVGDLLEIVIPIERVASRTLDAIDPTASSNPDGVDPGTGECYPGCRGADQLIVYTPRSGARTGTNQFGYEVTVVDGRVVERGGNDVPIPDDGYVVSGHGGQGSWLEANTILGAKVAIDDLTITITIDASAYLFTARRTIEAAASARDAGHDACLDLPYADADAALSRARTLLADARGALDSGDERRAVDLAEEATAAAELASWRTLPTRPVEGRSIWVRPEATTRAGVEATLDRLADANINQVHLETFFNGATIFPSDAAAAAGVAEQMPVFAEAGIDALAVWVEEAHERDIELHAWVENFFVGNEASVGIGPILEIHPEWAAVEREDVDDGEPGPEPSSREPGYYFLDPAIPEARGYLLDVYRELLAEYDVDGIHLDYIRYPVSLPVEASFSYSDHSRRAFAAEYGVDPYTIAPETDPAAWEDWVAWRQQNITSFVGEVRGLVDEERPDAALSAAVFPDPFDSAVRKLQDWSTWVEQGWMDVLYGMSFGRSGTSVAADTSDMLEVVGDQTLVSTGTYAPFLGLPPETMLEQVQAVRDAGAQGVALFSELQLTDRQADALAEGVFRRPADAPHSEPVAAVVTGAQDLRGRIDEHYRRCLGDRRSEHLDRTLARVTRLLDAPDNPGRRVAAARQLTAAGRRLDRATGAPTALTARLGGELELYRAVLDSSDR